MEDVIITLQKYQTSAINNGMSYSLDIIKGGEETKALVTIRSSVSNGKVDDQRYMKVSISSDEEPEFVSDKLICINNFIYQVSTSLNYKEEE